jgi:hypothetical protein
LVTCYRKGYNLLKTNHWSDTLESDIVRVDKRYRRNLFSAYLVIIISALIVWNFGRPPLVLYVNNLPNKQRIETIETVEHIIMLLFIPAALYLVNIGRKVCRFKAFPYPGMRVIRDTVIIRGRKALFRGRSMIVLGAIMIVMVIASMIINHYLTLHFKNNPLIRPFFYGTEV